MFYLWNPFNEVVMARFKETLLEKYGRIGSLSGIRIVYHNCRHADVWTTDKRCSVEPIVLPPDVEHRAILITFPQG